MCIYTQYWGLDLMKSYSSKMIIKLIEAAGWYEVTRKGSHIQFKHPTIAGRNTVPANVKDLPIGTLRSICEKAGLPWPPD